MWRLRAFFSRAEWLRRYRRRLRLDAQDVRDQEIAQRKPALDSVASDIRHWQRLRWAARAWCVLMVLAGTALVVFVPGHIPLWVHVAAMVVLSASVAGAMLITVQIGLLRHRAMRLREALTPLTSETPDELLEVEALVAQWPEAATLRNRVLVRGERLRRFHLYAMRDARHLSQGAPEVRSPFVAHAPGMPTTPR